MHLVREVNGPAQSYCSAPNGERAINQSYDAASPLFGGELAENAAERSRLCRQRVQQSMRIAVLFKFEQ